MGGCTCCKKMYIYTLSILKRVPLCGGVPDIFPQGSVRAGWFFFVLCNTLIRSFINYHYENYCY